MQVSSGDNNKFRLVRKLQIYRGSKIYGDFHETLFTIVLVRFFNEEVNCEVIVKKTS